MTITLKGVVVLLGLPINGDPILKPDYPKNYMELCEPLLGLASPEDVRWGNDSIVATWFREQLAGDIPRRASPLQIVQRARAIMLHIITQRLFCD